jgi:hypothetical protein
MRRLVEHIAGAVALATLMALLVPASAARPSHDDPGLSAMINLSTASTVTDRAAATTDGRWKLGGDGSCYWDPDDSGPDQCSQSGGRWKLGGDGSCYWDASDSGPNQCAPAAAESPAVEVRAVSPRTSLHPGV